MFLDKRSISSIPVVVTSTCHTYKRRCYWNELSFEINLAILLSTHLTCHFSRPLVDCITSLYCKFLRTDCEVFALSPEDALHVTNESQEG
uniref:Ovule protein n=1 Tax=Heterorhabditis bacteriophora TaxID=37862 RepID=A0A1I7X9T6_HETBA